MAGDSGKSGDSEIKIDDSSLKQKIARALLRFARPTLLLQAIGEMMVNSTRKRFETFTDPDGRRWQPLHPDTIKYKKKNKDKILTLDGYLKRQIRPELIAMGFGVKVASDRAYANTHQFGDPRRGIPKRAFLGVSAADKVAMLLILRDYVIDAFFGRR